MNFFLPDTLLLLCDGQKSCGEHPFTMPPLTVFLWMVFVQSILCYTLQNWATTWLPCSHVSLFVLLQVVVTVSVETLLIFLGRML